MHDDSIAAPGRGCRPPQGERGFSLVEVLIASLIMLFVALGIIPMFTMAMRSNLQGSENTRAANYARERLEHFWQLPFDHPDLAIAAGTELTLNEYYDETLNRWTDGVAPGDALWTRETVIRQFAVDDLATPISKAQADEDPVRVQLKEITVSIDSYGSNLTGWTGENFAYATSNSSGLVVPSARVARPVSS